MDNEISPPLVWSGQDNAPVTTADRDRLRAELADKEKAIAGLVECLKGIIDDIECDDWAGVYMIIKHTAKRLINEHDPAQPTKAQEMEDG